MSYIKQARMQSGTATLTAWIDVRPGVEVGAVLTLEKLEGEWTVISLSEQVEKVEVKNLGRRHRDVHGGLT